MMKTKSGNKGNKVANSNRKERSREFYEQRNEKLTTASKKLIIGIIIIGICVAGAVGTAAYMFYSKNEQNKYIEQAYSNEFIVKQAVYVVEPVTTNVLGQTDDIVYTDIGNFQIDSLIKSNKVVLFKDIFGDLQLIDTMTLRNATDYFSYVYKDYNATEDELVLDDTTLSLDYSNFLKDMHKMENTSALLDIFKIVGIATASIFFILVIVYLILKHIIKIGISKIIETDTIDMVKDSSENNAMNRYLRGIEVDEDEQGENDAPLTKKEIAQRKKEEALRKKEEAKQEKNNAKQAKIDARNEKKLAEVMKSKQSNTGTFGKRKIEDIIEEAEESYYTEDEDFEAVEDEQEDELVSELDGDVEAVEELETVEKPVTKPVQKPVQKPAPKQATTKPSTTKPSTTKPSTTKPATKQVTKPARPTRPAMAVGNEDDEILDI